MCVGEAEQGNHIIPLTDDPKIRFFKQTGLAASVSIKDELDGLKKVGLCTVDHYSIGIEQLEAKEKEWRNSRDKEGFVVYYKVDGKVCQIKYKAIPYIILRALREFLNSNRGKECFGVPFNEKSASTVLSLANRPEHVKQVIAYFLETHLHLQALCKNKEFSPIVEKNIEEYKKDIPQFIQYLLHNGYCEKDLGYDGDFGIGQLYKKFKEAGNVQAGEGSRSFSGDFQGLIIAISGLPGIGKDAVAEELSKHADYVGKSVILSKDMAAKAVAVLQGTNSKPLSDKEKTQKRNKWLKDKIKEAVSNNDIIITTTCNGSSKELAWITDAAKQYNLAVAPVYPEVSCKEDRTAFLAALIVSVLRRKDHPTLSASRGESLNGKFAEVIKDRVIKDFYTYASADENGRQKIPACDFNDKCSPTQLLNYFDLSKFDASLKKTGLSEEQSKIQNALLDVVKFIKNEDKEIAKESLSVLQEAKELEINQIFRRVEVDNLRDALIGKINKLKNEGLCYERKKQESSMSSNRQVNYYGAFLDDKAITMLKEKVRATLEDVEKLPDWIKTYLNDKTTQANSSGLKNDLKRVGVANRSSTHLTLAHVNLLHKLDLKASAELGEMLAENEGNDAEVSLKVEGICYNEGVLYASGVRVLCKGDDKTASLVASGVPHITLTCRPGISPVYALFAEEVRRMDPSKIEMMSFEEPLIIVANVRSDYKNKSISNKKKGQQTSARSLSNAVNEGVAASSSLFFDSPTSSAQARQADEASPSVRMKPN
jgi:thymidylate kinase